MTIWYDPVGEDNVITDGRIDKMASFEGQILNTKDWINKCQLQYSRAVVTTNNATQVVETPHGCKMPTTFLNFVFTNPAKHKWV